MKCFYCRCELSPPGMKKHAATMQTRDHLIPRSKLDPFIQNVRKGTHLNWRRLNNVHACFSCNQRKADMDPLDWLLMLDDKVAWSVGERLRRLGVPGRDVDAAMGRRNRMLRAVSQAVFQQEAAE